MLTWTPILGAASLCEGGLRRAALGRGSNILKSVPGVKIHWEWIGGLNVASVPRMEARR